MVSRTKVASAAGAGAAACTAATFDGTTLLLLCCSAILASTKFESLKDPLLPLARSVLSSSTVLLTAGHSKQV